MVATDSLTRSISQAFHPPSVSSNVDTHIHTPTHTHSSSTHTHTHTHTHTRMSHTFNPNEPLSVVCVGSKPEDHAIFSEPKAAMMHRFAQSRWFHVDLAGFGLMEGIRFSSERRWWMGKPSLVSYWRRTHPVMDCVNMTHLIVKTQQQWLQRLTCERDELWNTKKRAMERQRGGGQRWNA